MVPGKAFSMPSMLRIRAALNRLPVPWPRESARLLEATRQFISSQWFDEALRCGWTLHELFGLDSFTPLYDAAWGLVVGLALAPSKSDEIANINEGTAVIVFKSAHGWRRRIEKRFTPPTDAVLWWQCKGLLLPKEPNRTRKNSSGIAPEVRKK